MKAIIVKNKKSLSLFAPIEEYPLVEKTPSNIDNNLPLFLLCPLDSFFTMKPPYFIIIFYIF